VRRAQEGSAKLGPIEALALAVALDHVRRLGLALLEGGEAPPAAGALTASPDGVAIG
jgi:hypothetical protein